MTQFNRFQSNDDFIRRIYNKSKNTLSYESFIHTYKKFNDIIRKVSLENNLTLVDLDSLIQKIKIIFMISSTFDGKRKFISI